MHHVCPYCSSDCETPADKSSIICHACGGEYQISISVEPIRKPETVTGEQLEISLPDNVSTQPDETAEVSADALQDPPPPQKDSDSQTNAHTEPQPEVSSGDSEIPPPAPGTPQLWNWLVAILTLICIAGFSIQKDAWMDNRWLRSSLIDLGFSLDARAKDWQIMPGSIQAKWIELDNGNHAMQIDGRIQNLLGSDMPAPEVTIIFYSAEMPTQQLVTLDLPLTTPVPRSVIGPFTADESKDFSLLLLDVPEDSGDFTLTPRVESNSGR